MSASSAARTNLTSQCVTIQLYNILGEGHFRVAFAGTYNGGTRNSQEAVCKCFKQKFVVLESEFFASDFRATDRAIKYAEEWNRFCQSDKTILITRGDIHHIGGRKYLIEPLIRNFTKFTSNNGWINPNEGWCGEAMEAFTHYTYHRSSGMMIVCDLQGRYRDGRRFINGKSRFELTDIAVCSRTRSYGPTDLGEKGIDSFFHSHVCNSFCHADGYWSRPNRSYAWFPQSSSTSMMRSSQSHLLALTNRSTFQPGFEGILEEDSEDYVD